MFLQFSSLYCIIHVLIRIYVTKICEKIIHPEMKKKITQSIYFLFNYLLFFTRYIYIYIYLSISTSSVFLHTYFVYAHTYILFYIFTKYHTIFRNHIFCIVIFFSLVHTLYTRASVSYAHLHFTHIVTGSA